MVLCPIEVNCQFYFVNSINYLVYVARQLASASQALYVGEWLLRPWLVEAGLLEQEHRPTVYRATRLRPSCSIEWCGPWRSFAEACQCAEPLQLALESFPQRKHRRRGGRDTPIPGHCQALRGVRQGLLTTDPLPECCGVRIVEEGLW